MTPLRRIADAIEAQITETSSYTMSDLARAALTALRAEASELHGVGEAAICAGREADGVLVAMIDAVLSDG